MQINLPFFLSVFIALAIFLISKYFSKQMKNEQIEKIGTMVSFVLLIVVIVITYIF